MDQFKGMMADLAQNEIFMTHIERIQTQRPEVPAWNGGADQASIEHWKRLSAQREGWDLFYQKLMKP